jgi:IS5 family transposase
MLRMYLLQVWFSLSDEMLEDSIYDSQSMRKFVGINFLEENVPDATMLLKFRHLLEKHELTKKMFSQINDALSKSGCLMKEGTIVDATIIAAPSSTKNKENQRDPEMHQTKKGNQWYFGMKAHIGVDSKSGMVHTVEATAANEHDITLTSKLLHGAEKIVYADAGYTGVNERPEIKEEHAEVEWKVAIRRNSILKMEDSPEKDAIIKAEHDKASITFNQSFRDERLNTN